MKKNTIRLTESQLKEMVAKSVKKVLKEGCGYCNCSDSKFNYLANEIMGYVEDWGISLEMQDNKTFKKGWEMLDKAVGTLSQGFNEYYYNNGQNNYVERTDNDYPHAHETGYFDADYLK